MKKTILFLAFLLPALLCSTVIPAGDVSGVWNLAGSPYYVDGEITIQSDTELEIEPGVDVIFNDHYKFLIYGRIVAIGTETDSIKFMPLSETLGWHGLRFYDGNLSSLSANEISYCQFKRGYALGNGDDPNGGAIFCSNTSNLIIDNSYFYLNYSQWDGGAIYVSAGSDVQINDCSFLENDGFYGGAIISYASAPVLSNCTFKLNTAVVFGAGISFWNGSNLELYNCTFLDNSSGACAGIYGVSSSLIMANILFVNNTNASGSGAACGLVSCTTEATNVTAVDNFSPLSGGAFWVNGGDLSLYNSILWNNLPEDIYIINAGTVNAFNSCISDGTVGTAVISDDPQFINYAEQNLRLEDNSPCIDTGDETLVSFPLPDFDLDGNDRIVDGDENGTATIDMGVYEFIPEAATGFIAGTVTDSEGNFLENAEITAGTYTTQTDVNGEYELEIFPGNYMVNCYLDGYEIPSYEQAVVLAGETVIVDFVLIEEVGADDQLLVSALTILGNYPNPFNPSTKISFAIPQHSTTSVIIYNAKGQFVKELFNNYLSAGQHDFHWNGTDEFGKRTSSGLYFYTIKTETEIQTGKMLMLK